MMCGNCGHEMQEVDIDLFECHNPNCPAYMSDPNIQQSRIGAGIKYDVNFQDIDYQTMHLLRMFIERYDIPKGKVKIKEYHR